jgi:DNA-binding transcriptional ArsR family regulator
MSTRLVKVSGRVHRRATGSGSKFGPTAYSVLSVIAADVSRAGPTSRLSIERVAERVGKSVSSTRDAIDILKAHNLLAVERDGRSNVYRVLPLEEPRCQ